MIFEEDMSDRRTFLRQLGLGSLGMALFGCAPSINYNLREIPKNTSFSEVLIRLESLHIPIEETFTFYNSGTDRVIIFSPDVHKSDYSPAQNKRLALLLQHFPIDEVFLEGLEGKLTPNHLRQFQQGEKFLEQEVQRRQTEIIDAVSSQFHEVKDAYVAERNSSSYWNGMSQMSEFGLVTFEESRALYQLALDISEKRAFFSHHLGPPGNLYLETALQYGKGKGLEKEPHYTDNIKGTFGAVIPEYFEFLQKEKDRLHKSWERFEITTNKDGQSYKKAREVRDIIEEIGTQLKLEIENLQRNCPTKSGREFIMQGANRNKGWVENINTTEGKMFYVIGGVGHSCFFRELAPAIDASFVMLQPLRPLEDKEREGMHEAFKRYCIQEKQGVYEGVFPVAVLK